MRVLVQRSLDSMVKVENKIVGKIDKGLVVFVGFTEGDTIEDIEEMVSKIIHLRIFADEKGIMNQSLVDTAGSLLCISQFTLYADTSRGRRPSYMKALGGDKAIHLYKAFKEKLSIQNIHVETGIFGADMKVHITNDGPVTIWLESRNKDEKK